MKHKAYLMAISHLSVTVRKKIQSSDNYLLLLFHVGTSDTARSNQRSTKDYRALEAATKHSGTQAVFTPIFPVKGKGLKVPVESEESVNAATHRGLATLDHGTHFEKPGLPGDCWGSSIREGKEYLWTQVCQAGEEAFELQLPGRHRRDMEGLECWNGKIQDL